MPDNDLIYHRRVVINYDFPTGIEDYVHRIGRTGRAGATGLAYTFFAEQDAKYASDLVKVLEGANQRVPPEIREMAARGGGGMGRSRRWGSGTGGRDGGRGGRNDSSYGGRDGGRGDWGMPPSSSRLERGGGRGNDQDPRDRYIFLLSYLSGVWVLSPFSLSPNICSNLFMLAICNPSSQMLCTGLHLSIQTQNNFA